MSAITPTCWPRAKTASRTGPRADPAPEGHYRRRSAGVAGHVDAFATHQPDAGATGKAGDIVYLRDSAPGMMKHISDQVLVMHRGEVVERGSTADVLASPLHDLTKRLIAGHFGEALTADAWRKDR